MIADNKRVSGKLGGLFWLNRSDSGLGGLYGLNHYDSAAHATHYAASIGGVIGSSKIIF